MVHLKLRLYNIFSNKFFQAGLELQEDDHRKALLVSRKKNRRYDC